MKAALKSRIAQYTALVALLLAPSATSYAQIQSNANVNPCINTTVLDSHGNNVCVTAGGALSLPDIVVGTLQTGGVNVGGGTGFLIVGGRSSLAVNELVVGLTQSGDLTVSGGAAMTVGHGVTLANPGVFGNVTVSGGQLTVTGQDSYFSVSNGGPASVSISSGGVITMTGASAGMNLGFQLGDNGNVDIGVGGVNLTGQNSHLTVGDAGTGYFNIHDGGQVTAASMTIGNQATGYGLVNVTGGSATSTLTVADYLNVGYQSTGGTLFSALNINAGGTVKMTSDNASLVIGSQLGSNGVVDVSGGTLNLPGQNSYITVADAGTGNLTITNGGKVSATGMVLGNQATGFGTVNVGNGVGQSTLTVANSLTVGNQGIGANYLAIQSGGTVAMTSDNAALVIGLQLGSNGTVNLNGGTLNLTGQNSYLGVGNGGNGTLNVSVGGQVNAVIVDVGRDPGGFGLVNISGTGSMLNISNNIDIGNEGVGQVNVSLGGRLVLVGDSARATLGFVQGTPPAGMSTLNIYTGGQLMGGGTNQGLSIGTSAGTNDVVTVSGGVVSLSGANSYITVGDAGTGTLTIQNGGQVAVASMIIGNQTTGNGSVTVADAESSLAVANNLTVGNRGAGTLTVDSGGAVIVRSNTASGTMTVGGQGDVVIGPGSQITVFGNFTELAGGALTFGIDGFDPSVQGPNAYSGFLMVDGSATLNGTINLQFRGSSYAANQHWDIGSSALNDLTWGDFSVSGLPSNLTYCPEIDQSNGDLQILLLDFAGVTLGGVAPIVFNGGASMGARFTPNCGVPLSVAAGLAGPDFTHFNWGQEVTLFPGLQNYIANCVNGLASPTCDPSFTDRLGTFPQSTPFIDTALGGWYYQTVTSCNPGQFPVQDNLDWYLDEQFAVLNSPCHPGRDAFIAAAATGLPPVVDQFTSDDTYLNFVDSPSNREGYSVYFATCLSAVRADGSGESLQNLYTGGADPLGRTVGSGGVSQEQLCWSWRYNGTTIDSVNAFDVLGQPGHGTVDFLGPLAASDMTPQELALFQSMGRATVPEPPLLPLFAIALLAMAAADNRRRRLARRSRA
jgi:T5SS/PEP-CTERM-associated repeat protein